MRYCSLCKRALFPNTVSLLCKVPEQMSVLVTHGRARPSALAVETLACALRGVCSDRLKPEATAAPGGTCAIAHGPVLKLKKPVARHASKNVFQDACERY